jgi:phospholipase C
MMSVTKAQAADRTMPQIKHVVVLMLENRSLDNLLGWLYAAGEPPARFIPEGSAQRFDGLDTGSYSNSDPSVNGGQPVPAANGTTSWTSGGYDVPPTCVPSPDPGEVFDDVNVQIAGNMSGFLSDYVTQVNAAGGPAASAVMIMESYSPEQLPVISGLARFFAVSDA